MERDAVLSEMRARQDVDRPELAKNSGQLSKQTGTVMISRPCGLSIFNRAEKRAPW